MKAYIEIALVGIEIFLLLVVKQKIFFHSFTIFSAWRISDLRLHASKTNIFRKFTQQARRKVLALQITITIINDKFVVKSYQVNI